MQAHEYSQTAGPFSNEMNSWAIREMNLTRQAIASELSVPAETITLTENVTVGCNIAMWGIDWREGDHMLLSDCEHPGVIAAAEEIRRRFGIKLSFCPLMATLNQGDPVSAIVQHLRPTTRLVMLSHILWNTGQVLPLADVATACQSYPTQYAPIRILVDAAQSVGVLPLNLQEVGVDFYAFTGHKWWCGPAGVGALYVRPEAIASLSPTFVGWRGIIKNAKGLPTGWLPDGRRFEIATSDFTLYPALRQAIALHHQWGTAGDRYQRIKSLSEYLWQRLSALPQITCLRTAPPEAGLVSFRVQGEGSSIHKNFVLTLEKQGFLLRTLLDPDCVRACVHYFTLESEIDRLVEAIENLD
jgi:L-cysteine/cystine lyase